MSRLSASTSSFANSSRVAEVRAQRVALRGVGVQHRQVELVGPPVLDWCADDRRSSASASRSPGSRSRCRARSRSRARPGSRPRPCCPRPGHFRGWGSGGVPWRSVMCFLPSGRGRGADSGGRFNLSHLTTDGRAGGAPLRRQNAQRCWPHTGLGTLQTWSANRKAATAFRFASIFSREPALDSIEVSGQSRPGGSMQKEAHGRSYSGRHPLGSPPGFRQPHPSACPAPILRSNAF